MKIIEDSNGDESDSPDDAEDTKQFRHGVDHPSASTDPSFFNSVFNEQQDAGREHSEKHEVMDSAEESEAVDPDSSDQELESVENAEEAHVEKSLWDVPSSPEFMEPKRSAKKAAERMTRTKVTRGLRRQLDDIGYISPDDEQSTQQNSSKRRRTHPQTDVTDELVPLIPPDDGGSLFVTQRKPMSRQREHLSTSSMTAFSSPTQPFEQCDTNVCSSGSLTNVNTPREGYNFLTKLSSSERPSGSAPGIPEMTQVGMYLPRDTSTAIKVGNEHAPPDETEEVDATYQEEPTPRPTTTKRSKGRPKKVADPVSTIGEGAVIAKVKKKRGRPKKSGNAEMQDDDKADDEDEASADTKAIPNPSNKSPNQGQQMDRFGANQAAVPEGESVDIDTANNTRRQETPSRQADDKCSSTENVTGKKADTAPSGSGRQLYRVGLSKRTKITPLLKVIRR